MCLRGIQIDSPRLWYLIDFGAVACPILPNLAIFRKLKSFSNSPFTAVEGTRHGNYVRRLSDSVVGTGMLRIIKSSYRATVPNEVPPTSPPTHPNHSLDKSRLGCP